MTPDPEFFQLVISGLVMEQLRECSQQADEAGLRDQYRETLLDAHNALRTRPLEWGDPQFSFHALGLVVCQRYLRGFHVGYAVDAERRIVYLREIRLIRRPEPDSPERNGNG